MDFEVILPIALKVLGCAVGIYFIAGFLMSLTKLLPFLAILSSVGTIWSINYVLGAGDESLLWLPIATTLLTRPSPAFDEDVRYDFTIAQNMNGTYSSITALF